MAAGIFEIAQALHGAIQATVPRSQADKPFKGPVPGDGTGSEPLVWIEEPNRETRDFVIQMETLPIVSGGCHLEAEIAIRVAYARSEADVYLLIAEDMGRIATTLQDPAVWGGADSIWAAGAPEVQEIASGDGRPVTLVAKLILAVYYRETV